MMNVRNLVAAAAIAVAGIAASGSAQASPYVPYCYGYQTQVTHLGPIWRTHLDRVTVFKKVRIGFYCAKVRVAVYYRLHRGIFFPYYKKPSV